MYKLKQVKRRKTNKDIIRIKLTMFYSNVSIVVSAIENISNLNIKCFKKFVITGNGTRVPPIQDTVI